MHSKKKASPPGRTKIMISLSTLMITKDFHSITTAEIARNAGVTEGLIYKYFKDKKDLLYQVLNNHFQTFYNHVIQKIEPRQSSIEKLSVIIRTTIKCYAENRVFAKILLLEVRNSQKYFSSEAYDMVKIYSATILDIIRQGIKNAEIKREVDPYALRQVILGSIEHACLTNLIFDKKINTESITKHICNIIFNGVRT